jgi:hypothetical protein
MPAVTYGFFAGPLSQVTRTNLIPNPSFETNTTGWAGSNITVTRSSTFSLFGGWALRGVVGSTGTNRFIDRSQTDVFVTAGLTYSYSCYVYLPATNTEDVSLVLQAFPWRAAGFLAGITLETKTVTRGVWTRLQGTFTAPATTTNCLFRVIRPASWAAGQEIFIDAALLEQSPTVGTYFDGTDADVWPDHTLLSQQWNGTTNNSTSTTVWENQIPAILDKDTSFTVTRGRQQVQDPFRAGTATVTGRDISQVANLEIGDTLFIRSLTYNGLAAVFNIFIGFISDIKLDYGFTSNQDTWTINAEDGLATLGRAFVTNSWAAGDTTYTAATKAALGTGITIANSGFPSGSTVSAQSFTNINLLDVINEIVTTEQGRLYAVDGDYIIFSSRASQNAFGTIVEFTDGTLSLSPGIEGGKFDNLIFRSQADSFYTKVITEPEGLAAQESGSGSRTYTVKTYDETTTQADNLADYILGTLQVSQGAPASISCLAEQQSNPNALFAAIFAPEGLYSVNVVLRGTRYSNLVEGSTISGNPSETRMTLNLSSPFAAGSFILDNDVLGVLDTSRLGF